MKKLIVIFIILFITLTSFFREYPSKVINVYDGDTITLEVNLGFDIIKTEKIRLYGINAPELRGAEREEGLKSRDALRKKILNKEVRLETLPKDKKGKYGRTIGTIWIGDENINNWMVMNDYAVVKHY